LRKIYLSSTYEDLDAYRDAVYRTLRQMRHDVISMEDYGASGQRPLDKCLADVAGCDAYVGLFAWRHGFVPPGERRSITELELAQAERSGRPCLVFILADDAPWSPKLMDDDRSAILALRNRLQERYTVQFFRSADEVARTVATAVANLFERDGTQEPSPQEIGLFRNCLARFAQELGRDIRFYEITSAVLAVFAMAFLGLALAAMNDTPQLLTGLGGLLFASSSPFSVATMRATRKKKALLDGYADELSKEQPAAAAVFTVRRFVETQLAGPRLT